MRKYLVVVLLCATALVSAATLSGCAEEPQRAATPARQEQLDPNRPLPGGVTHTGHVVATDGVNYTKDGVPVVTSALVKVQADGVEYTALGDSSMVVGDSAEIAEGIEGRWFVTSSSHSASVAAQGQGSPPASTAPKKPSGPRKLSDSEREEVWASRGDAHHDEAWRFRGLEIDSRCGAAEDAVGRHYGGPPSSEDMASHIAEVRAANKKLSGVTVTWYDYSSGKARARTYRPSDYGKRLIQELLAIMRVNKAYESESVSGSSVGSAAARDRLDAAVRAFTKRLDAHGEFIDQITSDPFTEYKWK